ncbi:MAG: proton-conducting transporter membrane subunit [Lentisphaeria bacterium]
MPLSTMFSFSLFALMFFVLFFGAVLSWFLRQRPVTACRIGAGSAILGCAAGLILAVAHLFQWVDKAQFPWMGLDWRLDALSGFFMLPVLLVGIAAACHSVGYLEGRSENRQGVYWLFFNLTLLSMLLVTAADTYVELLLTWEAMCVTSFALVAFDYKEDKVRHAAWVYILASHAGALLLILMFALQTNASPAAPVAALVCGLLGFGMKSGFPLLHVWLPPSYDAAPPPATSVMSAGMVNLGICGMMRFLPPVTPALIGWILLAVGVTSALMGILLAMTQSNLKRLLAYSSVENMGIVFLGMGLGFLGLDQGNTAMAICGIGGAMLHIWNHAFLKGTLFLLAGTVQKATGTVAMDEMGGLGKNMPITKSVFTCNAAALCGLPPGNAFLSEAMIYLAAFQCVVSGSNFMLGVAMLAAIALALTGGLAAATFSKAVSAVFQGEPRSDAIKDACEAPRTMRAPTLFLSGMAFIVFLTAPWLWNHVLPAVLSQADAIGTVLIPDLASYGSRTLAAVRNFSLLTIVLIIALEYLRDRRMRQQPLEYKCTWDCGYALPTSRMQYTGTAFTQPLSDFFNLTKGKNRTTQPPEGYFPTSASVDIEVTDPADHYLWRPINLITSRIADRTRRIQSGYLHIYILMAVIALLAMLIFAAVTPTRVDDPPIGESDIAPAATAVARHTPAP